MTILIFSCQDKHDYLDKNHWISTYTEFWSQPGTYLDLTDKDSLYLTYHFDFENLKKYKYSIDSLNKLVLNDTISFGIIIKKTNDILIIKDSLQTNAFIPIRNYNINLDTLELQNILISKDWTIIENKNKFRIEFTNKPYFSNQSKIKTFLKINETKGWESLDGEMWTIDQIDKSLFIVLTIGQTDYQVYQIKEISDTLILTETCWADSIEEVQFLAIKKLPINRYSKIKSSLIGTWSLIDYSEPVDSSSLLYEEEIIWASSRERLRPYRPEDSVPILFDTYFKNKELIYTFSEKGICNIKKENEILRDAEWSLSDDGKYIKTKNGWMHSMRILSLNDTMLITGKHETIELADSNIFENKFIIEKMIKIK